MRMFFNLGLFFRLGENTPSYNGPVTKVHASDADSGENSVVSYSLSSPSAGFSIDSITGIITVNQSLLGKDLLQKVRYLCSK